MIVNKEYASSFMNGQYSVSEDEGKFTFKPSPKFLKLGPNSRIDLSPVVIEADSLAKAEDLFIEGFLKTLKEV